VGYRWHEKNASHAYRFERGIEECLLASRRALQYYRERTGCQEKAEILADALVPLAELRRWAARLDRGKAWLEEQSQSWQRVAEERERIVQEHKAWIGKLEQSKAWLEEQSQSWQRMAEEREQVIKEQKVWVEQLEQGKAWLEVQRASWQRIAEEREQVIKEQKVWIEQLQGTIEQLQGTIEQLQGTIGQLRHQWIPQPLRQMVKNIVRGEEVTND
jgi:predicted NUDIX family NTP pyrophosphohydrolase